MRIFFGNYNKKFICILISFIVIVTSFGLSESVYGEVDAVSPQSPPVVQRPIYTVTFNGNGGKASLGSKQVQYSNIYGALPTATRSKYVFRGWYTAKKGGTEVTQYSRVNIGGNQVLYARWQKTLSYEKEVLKYVNKERKKKRLKKLKWDKKLHKGTKKRATEITKKFSHTRPKGGSGARFLLKYVKKGRSSGECLGMGFNDPQKLVTAFMNSASHKRIIMMKKARTCAISSKVKSGTTYWCLGTSALYR